MKMKTSGILAWSRLIDSIGRLIWILVIVVIVAALGRYFILRSQKAGKSPPPVDQTKPVVVKPIPWDQIDRDMAIALENSRIRAEEYAYERLDAWIDDLMERVDNDFLDWYFDYWNQQILGLKGLYQSIVHWVDSEAPTAAEKITEEIQGEFAKRVLRPQIAQLELEQLTQDVVDRYVNDLRENLSDIPLRYNVPQGAWDRYLDDIAVVIHDVEGNRKVSLTLKALTFSSVGAAVLLGKSLQATASRVGSRVSTRLAGKAAARMAAKTGGKVAGRAGGKLLGPIIGIGIIIWDVLDHYKTQKVSRPILRQNILDYLNEVKMSLLHDPETGIMTVIYSLERSILESLESVRNKRND